MSGLSYFDQGSQADDEQETPVSVPAKPSAGKGTYALPTIAGNVNVNQGVLSAMEQMYVDKLNQQQGFMEAMKDAAAWWSGGVEGPSAALSRREKDREAQAANLFQLQTQIAQYKAAQESAKKQAQNYRTLLGGGEPTAGAPAEGGAGSDIPQNVRGEMSRLLDAGDVAGADKVYKDWFKTNVTETVKFLNNAASYKADVEMIDPRTGEYTIVNAIDAKRLYDSGAGRPTGRTTGGAAPTGELTTADKAIPPAPVTTAPAPAPAPAAPAPAPAAAPKNYTFDELSPDQLATLQAKAKSMGLQGDVASRPDAAELFNKQPLDKRKAIFGSLQPEPAAAAPAAPAAPVKPKESIAQARLRLKTEEQERGEEIKIVAKEYETFRSDVKSAPIKETTASEAITLLTRDPTIAGILQKPGVGAALGTLVKTGISAPGGHSIGIKEIDEVLFKGQKNVTPEQIRARDRLRTLFNTNSLLAASIMKGQGQITEFERQLLERMVGSLDSTPENLVKIQKVLQARAKLDMSLGEKFNKSGLTYNKFTSSPEYMNSVRDYHKQIKDIEDEDVRKALPRSQGQAPRSGATTGGVKWREVK